MALTTSRLRSLDIIRGAVMVLMALDHVRVFAGVPAGSQTAALFLTRWVTNFCAPAFVFLAGTGAFLYSGKLRSKGELSRYLLVRGALLVFLDMTVCRLSWTFNLDFYNYNDANVLWAIGWSMIALAGLIHLPLRVIAAFGLVVIAGHNVTDFWHDQLLGAARGSGFAPLLQLLYFGGEFRWFGTGPNLVILYSIIPWVGVIAAGYAFGAVMTLDPARRRSLCLSIGIGATVLFLVLRAFNIYGNPWPWSGEKGFVPGVLSFLGTNKYPASLQFLLMTLGPVIALIPLLESAAGWLATHLVTFGRVPLFYYLIHIPFIHATALLIALVRTPAAVSWLFENHPLRVSPAPDGYRYSLPLLYAVTLLVVCTLYFPCRWYADLKARRRDSWLTYI
jgi:uncharacterized membrane protein